ncbi:hypothetical protein [Desulfocurvus sp. DL9XJH121]
MSATTTIAQREFERAGTEFGEHLEGAHRVYLTEVAFSRSAQCTIGLAVKDIAARCGVFAADIVKAMCGHMYWLEKDESLVIVFPVPQLEADMLVEIPRGHWRFRDQDLHTH